jgi:hypothetical protein
MESVGFKEWSLVCDALGEGRQSILLRKGGIAEGRDGFSFKHREFLLFPTWFHEQPQKVRQNGGPGQKPTLLEEIEIRLAAKLELTRSITSWTAAQALEPFHILKRAVVRERFDYDEAPGIHVAFVRVFRVVPAWRFPNEKKYGGCRSWVRLPEIPENSRLEPVLTDAEHEERRAEFMTILERSESAVDLSR